MSKFGAKVFFLFFLFFSSTTIWSQKIIFFKGTVNVANKEEGPFLTVTKGHNLALGDFIKTGLDSFAIVSFPSGSTLKVDPDTIVEINEIEKEGDDKSATSIFRLIRGAILTKFIKGEDKELIVENEYVALAVRGTEFFFGEDGGEAYAAVNSGEIAVINKGDFDYESLKAGNALVIENKKDLTKPESFEWAKNLNWGSKEGTVGQSSGFRSKKLRTLRNIEIAKKIQNLRQRRKQNFQGKFKNRIQRAQIRKSARKKFMKNQTQGKSKLKKNKVQNFKNKLKKRGVIKRRRN